MTPTRTLVAAIVASVSTLSMAAPPATQPFFPIMAWDMAPSDPAALRKMHDAGITIAGFAPVASLPAVHAAGLKAIVHDPRVAGYDWTSVDDAAARKNVTSLIAETKDSPAVFGYYLRDEPNAGMFPGLAKLASLVKELHPGTWPYINLFPNYASPAQLQSKDYQDYLDKFTAACQPPIISYDNYFLLAGPDNVQHYYSNLELVRAHARKHDVPFWNIVLANAHFAYAEPTHASLLHQAYSTLAYGGRGLAYFTYFAPNIGNFRLSPIDQFGNPTPTWDLLRNVNLQVLKLAPTLLQLNSARVYHFTPTPGTQPPPPDAWVPSAGSPHLMVGEFTHATDKSRYVLIVNKDLTQSAPVNLELRPPAKSVELISPYTGDPIPFTGEQIWLSPGAGHLLHLRD